MNALSAPMGRVPSLLPRLARYVLEMCPPAAAVGIGAGIFASMYLGLQALAGLRPLQLDLRVPAGSLCLALWVLWIRLQDDQKDASHDRRLAAAGDPRYVGRPTVRGLVSLVELARTARVTVVLMCLLSLAIGRYTTLALAVGLVLNWLALNWFFVRWLRELESPLPLLARKTLASVMALYPVGAFVDAFPAEAIDPQIAFLLLSIVAVVLVWESSRKIRVTQDETEYQTYSKRLGWRAAALLPGVLGMFCLAAMLCFTRAAHLAWPYPVLIITTALVNLVAGVRFRLQPSRAHARLEPFARLLVVVALDGPMVALYLESRLPIW